MSTQAEVNTSPCKYILYYMGVEQKDTAVWPTDLSGVCRLGFADDNTIVCDEWMLKGVYPAPSNETLLSYASAEVLAWYDGFYVLPDAIADFQYFKISASALASVRTGDMRVGFKVFDTTNNQELYWDGKSWVSK